MHRFQPESLAEKKPFVDRITRTGEEKEATAQLSLGWLLAQKLFIVPIPGTCKVKPRWPALDAAEQKMAHGVEADGAQAQGIFDRACYFGEREGLH